VSESTGHANRLRGYLRLLRPPNLLTVPGDPLVGFLLTAWAWRWSMVWPILAALLLYAAGLVFNDLFDREEDARERPDRPLPSGAVSPRAATIAAAMLSIAALLVAWPAGWLTALTAAGLLGCVLAYDGGLKRSRLLGPLAMGSCRAVSVLLGAAGAWHVSGRSMSMSFIAAGVIGLYIAAVTAIARRETKPGEIGPLRFAPAAVLGAWLAMLIIGRAGEMLIGSAGYMVAAAVSLFAFAWALRCGKRLGGVCQPPVIQRTIGFFIRGLLAVQAGFACLMSVDPAGGFDPTGAIAAGALLALWPIASIASRKFYAS
jgi:4-hydroxybenzoate polyprenyltransferase